MARKELENNKEFQNFLKNKYRYIEDQLQILDQANNSPTKGQWREVAKVDNGNGYLNVTIRYKGKAYHYYQHRLIYFLVKNEWAEVIDHMDRDRKNNHISNLKGCSQAENCQNRISRVKPHGNTKYLGVSYIKSKKKYEAKITVNRKSIQLGRFLDPKDAAIARDQYIISHKLEHRYKLNFSNNKV